MLLLGIDVGTSSIKVSVVDAASGDVLSSAQFPGHETEILVPEPGWAEQSPELWWTNVQQAILLCHQKGHYNPNDISAIGIAYQMHGLVLVDEFQKTLKNSIIWCDSRAVQIGEKALLSIGEKYALGRLLNSPGNFTASKLAWVKANERPIYDQVAKMMLPGDFIAMKLTGTSTITNSALSEAILWDFTTHGLSSDVMKYFGFEDTLVPEVRPVFSVHGEVMKSIAENLGLRAGIPVSYKAGDQLNNALSLNVTQPGEVAATAGTSGVIYGVTDQLVCDPLSRVNTFAHVNHTLENHRLGVLLCINGTGSMNRWIKNIAAAGEDYTEMNTVAARISPGSDGLFVLPFGNGAERMLENQQIGAHFHQIDLNLHTSAHLFRAVQEGIACSFRYGLDILKENGMRPSIIRAGKSNLFKSSVFTQAFVDITGVPVELYNSDGSVGAAIGAGIGAGIYTNIEDAFHSKKPVALIEPGTENYETQYQTWKNLLQQQLTVSNK